MVGYLVLWMGDCLMVVMVGVVEVCVWFVVVLLNLLNVNGWSWIGDMVGKYG